MKYLLSDCRLENDIACEDYSQLKGLLKNGRTHWNYGSGDSAVSLPDQSIGLIFFKTDQGIFIEDFATNTAPLISQNPAPKSVTHYVGGDPLDVPDICLMDEETASRIIIYFVENNGNLHPEYEWINIYDYIPYRYDEFQNEEFEKRKQERLQNSKWKSNEG